MEEVDMLSNQVHPSHDHILFPNNNAPPPIHIAGTVQSWFEQYEGELQHLPWPAQSPHLIIIEPL
jgi:hypothetical protein